MIGINRRTGVVATKLGMTQVFSANGLDVIPVTLLKIEDNVVLDTKSKSKNGYDAVVIGTGVRNNVSKPVKGLIQKAGLASVRHIKEFRVSDPSALNVGDIITLRHFVVGQFIDVTGVSVGKGFAGVMKRYKFSGLRASHGVSASHRSGGSTGQRQDPGRVFKGKKMPGHMGARTVTMQNLEIIDIDVRLSIIAVKGAVPGSAKGRVIIKDAVKKHLPFEAPVPAGLKTVNKFNVL